MIDLQKIHIRKTEKSDSDFLSEIAFSAKKIWKYPNSYFEIWKQELTITEKYLERNIVFKAVYEDLIIGFYSIVQNKSDFYSGEVFVKKGFWLDHLFVDPSYHRMGIGTLLIRHIKMIASKNEIRNLLIFADPYAKGFYDKIGAAFLYNSKSSIPERLIPAYSLKI
jgi:maltose O-acetyltransferase